MTAGVCEICNEPVKPSGRPAMVIICGCEWCARLYGVCCASPIQTGYCVECKN